MQARIVIAEDHTLVRDGIRRILQQSDDNVIVGEASDGEEAVLMAAALRPDVVLMDISMPRLNGIEATRRIKARQPTTAVLVLTAHDDHPHVLAALGAGAEGYLLKTARSEELLGAVRAVRAGEVVLSPSVARKALGHNPAGGVDALTERELEVLRLTAKGLINKVIARQLGLSPRTVQVHLSHAFAKLGVASRTEAVTTCLERGWLHLEVGT